MKDLHVETGLPLKPGETKPSLSPSAIKLFLGCGEAFRLRYIVGEKRPKGAKRVFGTAAHAAVEENSKFKIVQGEEMPLADVKDVFGTEFDKDVQTALFDSVTMEQLRAKDDTEAKGRLKDAGYEAVEVYHQRVAPLVNPVEVERYFRVELDGPFDIVGAIDIVDRLDQEHDAVGDHKFSMSKRIRKADPQEWMEGTIYALAYSQDHDGQLPSEVYLSVVREVRGAFTPERASSVRTVDAVNKAISIAESVAHAVGAESFPPTGLGTWKCSEKYCDYYPCKFVSAMRGPE